MLARDSNAPAVSEPALTHIDAGLPLYCLSDLTRSGLASELVEIANGVKVNTRVELDAVPVPAQPYYLYQQ